jgi:hypothetical protein
MTHSPPRYPEWWSPSLGIMVYSDGRVCKSLDNINWTVLAEGATPPQFGMTLVSGGHPKPLAPEAGRCASKSRHGFMCGKPKDHDGDHEGFQLSDGSPHWPVKDAPAPEPRCATCGGRGAAPCICPAPEPRCATCGHPEHDGDTCVVMMCYCTQALVRVPAPEPGVLDAEEPCDYLLCARPHGHEGSCETEREATLCAERDEFKKLLDPAVLAAVRELANNVANHPTGCCRKCSAGLAERDALREALTGATRSLETLSHAGSRDAGEHLSDLIDVRGYAASRARVAAATLKVKT